MEIRTVLTIEVDDEDCDPVEVVENHLHTIMSNGECIAGYADICTRNNEKEKWKNISGVV